MLEVSSLQRAVSRALIEELPVLMGLLAGVAVVGSSRLWFNMIHQLISCSAARQIIDTILVSSVASKSISLHISASFRAQKKYISETI